MDQIWEKIETLIDSGNGFVRTSQVENIGISRPMLKKYVDSGKLKRVRKGIYVTTNGIADEYALLQAQNVKAIFSYGTALYLWGMSDRTPHFIDITIPHGTNMTTTKRNNENLHCHYIQVGLYYLGITKTVSPQGATVLLYDRERCICDLIRNKEQTEIQLYSHAIKEYFGNKPESVKLLKYGEVFGIQEKIRTYIEVLL
jgi:predicted transcriptional regulator of viral defense system